MSDSQLRASLKRYLTELLTNYSNLQLSHKWSCTSSTFYLCTIQFPYCVYPQKRVDGVWWCCCQTDHKSIARIIWKGECISNLWGWKCSLQYKCGLSCSYYTDCPPYWWCGLFTQKNYFSFRTNRLNNRWQLGTYGKIWFISLRDSSYSTPDLPTMLDCDKSHNTEVTNITM